MGHYLFIVNPISGNKDKTQLVGRIAQLCFKYKKEYSLFYTKGKNDESVILNNIKLLQPDRVIACGGDGTINLVAKLLINSTIPLGIVPAGSANGLAVELKIPAEYEQALELCFIDKYKPIDALCINKTNYSFHLSDFGFNASMIKLFEKSEERGMLAYVKAFFKSLKEKESITSNYTIKANGEKRVFKADMVIIANAAKYGTGAIVNPYSNLQDGLFEIVIFKPIPFTALVNLTLSAFIGSIKNSPYVEIIRTDKAKIEVDKAQLFQVDGQLLGEWKKVKVNIKKNAVNIIYDTIS
jgi:YegS/Rv2252/BmrU family lipid kinase